MPGAERRKFAGFGSLVLIPALLGVVSMSFAASTFTKDWRVCIGAGLLWGSVVLTIDRFLVSTLFKSTQTSKWSFYQAFVYRLLFAGIIGFMVADPLVLMIFSTSTKQQLAKTQRQQKDERLRQIERMKGEAEGTLGQDLSRKRDLRDCLMRALSAEGAGDKLTFTDNEGKVCATTSGHYGFSRGYGSLQSQINLINDDISKLEGQEQQNVEPVTDATSNDISDLETSFSDDYIARSRALATLESSEPRVRAIWRFLIVAFVFIDTLVIFLKVATPAGEYEEIRDSLLYEMRVAQAANRGAAEVVASTVLRNSERASRQHAATKAEMIAIMGTTNDFLAAGEVERTRFEAQISAIAKNVQAVRDEETKKIYMARLSDIRDIFNEAWGKAMSKFNAYLRGL
jgi:hypothetical protein